MRWAAAVGVLVAAIMAPIFCVTQSDTGTGSEVRRCDSIIALPSSWPFAITVAVVAALVTALLVRQIARVRGRGRH